MTSLRVLDVRHTLLSSPLAPALGVRLSFVYKNARPEGRTPTTDAADEARITDFDAFWATHIKLHAHEYKNASWDHGDRTTDEQGDGAAGIIPDPHNPHGGPACSPTRPSYLPTSPVYVPSSPQAVYPAQNFCPTCNSLKSRTWAPPAYTLFPELEGAGEEEEEAI
ncbi:hypothetical protein WJX73_003700 [Symbiochloris irregularis]|uniref:Uncharacterized protein n=1 Tax=Symbiochloris irregularis TaxID=706552 RepID=A0AAW1PAZ2_9CHLO